MMIHYANCDVISKQKKKFKLKYLIDKALERKSIINYTELDCIIALQQYRNK